MITKGLILTCGLSCALTVIACGDDGGSAAGSGGQGGTSGATTGGPSTSSTSSGASDGGGTSSGGGQGGAGGDGDGTDTPAPPKPTIDHTGRRDFRFSAASLDPDAKEGHADSEQIATVDTSKDLRWKLCVVLPGIGNGPGLGIGGWAAGKGYHVFQVGYGNDIPPAPDGDTNPDTPGNTRMEQFDGTDRTPTVTVSRADSIEERTIRAIKHLQEVDSGGGWGWYLNADGSMRWSDSCFIGYSYGATHLAVISRYVRIGRGISTSGPQYEGHQDATWLTHPSATPVERMFSIFGSEDGPDKYIETTEKLGWLGEVVHTTADAPAPANGVPFNGSHRIEVDGEGHTEFCAGDHVYCSWAFGLQ